MKGKVSLLSIILLVLAVVGSSAPQGCSGPDTGQSTVTEMEQTESNQQRLARAVPPPKLQTSLERKNLVRRFERINKEDQISYIYLISFGKIMAFYTVRGKVSSLNSLLTTPQQVIPLYIGGNKHGYILPSPDFDGSYGKNPDGIFFFTTEGVYIEWVGEFLWCDQPLQLAQPPELIQQIKK